MRFRVYRSKEASGGAKRRGEGVLFQNPNRIAANRMRIGTKERPDCRKTLFLMLSGRHLEPPI